VMPGMDWLAAELGVGVHTVGEALNQLEKEGLLIGQGHRRSRLIMQPKTSISSSLRLRILLYEESEAKDYYMVNLLHLLREEGH
jgi:DNA-binding GntR family transcriptional regulator